MSVERSSSNIPAGYKQTEVGVIPEDWEMKLLGNTAILKARIGWQGLTTSEYLESGDYYLVTGTEFKDGYIDWDNCHYVTESRYKQDKNIQLKENDILVTKDGTIGKVALINNLHKPATLNSGVFVIRPLNGAFHPVFFYYLLSSNLFKEFLAQLSAGSTINHLYQKDFVNFLYNTPPTLAEQEAIAEALGDADALIESLEQLISKKRQIKQGAMQELLIGKRRLPGFRGEWEVKHVEEIAEILSGGTPSTTQPQFWDGDILWCTPTDITALKGHKHLSETSRRITLQGLKCSSAEMIPANSIVMTSRATIGECAINQVPVSTNQGFKNLIPFENVDVEFLYYLLLTKKQEFISLCGGSTFLEIGKTQLLMFELKLPVNKSEQTAIAAILSDMDSEIIALEEKLAKARQIKQGMMQELLTGRIRLL